jgi:large subunit ribosomal protein L25
LEPFARLSGHGTRGRMETFTVEGQVREGRGKGPARRTRLTGMVPAILYGGKKKESISLSVNAKQVARILRSETGHNTIFTVRVADGAAEKAMVKDWQVDPVSGKLLHVDLFRIAMDVRMRVRVPVHTFGEPQGVKMQGGVFEMVTREVEVECLPADIPEEFKIDVSEMLIGKQLRAADLPFDRDKIKLLTDPVRVLAHVVILKKEEEPTPEAAVAAETAAAEPEVIKKGKKEEEGEGEAAAEAPAKAEKSEKKGKEK